MGENVTLVSDSFNCVNGKERKVGQQQCDQMLDFKVAQLATKTSIKNRENLLSV